MAQQSRRLRQALRMQNEDYWKRFTTFEQEYARGELREVHFNCSRNGFTLHGVEHAEAVENLLERLIPPELLVSEYDLRSNADAFTPEELLILLSAAWCHDLGMKDPGQRKVHNLLSRDCIWDSEKQESRFPWYFPANFAFYVGQLCYAHRDHQLDDGTRTRTLSEIKDVPGLGVHGNRVRLGLLAALLRLADELDVGFYRAPEDVMYVINLPEGSVRHWVENQLFNGVVIDSARLQISLVPFEERVRSNPIHASLIDARCLKIQEELDNMRTILRDHPRFGYREIYLGEEPIRRIMMRNLLSYHGRSIERYKDAVREMVMQVEEYDERFSDLAHVAQQLEEIAGSCKRLTTRPVLPSQPPESVGVAAALIAASDSGRRSKLKKALLSRFEEVFEADSASESIQAISEQEFAVIVTELNLDGERAGFDILEAARQTSRERGSHTQVVVLTPQGEPGISAEAIVSGAYDCLEYTSYSADFIKEVQTKVDEALDFRSRRGEGRGQS